MMNYKEYAELMNVCDEIRKYSWRVLRSDENEVTDADVAAALMVIQGHILEILRKTTIPELEGLL